MAAPQTAYRDRRGQLASRLQRPMVIFAGRPPARNYATNPHPFRAGSSYLYFGGPPLVGAALLIEPGSDGTAGCTLFREPAGPDDALWIGQAPDDGDIAAAAGVQQSQLADPDQLAKKLAGREAACISPPCLTTRQWIHKVGLQDANSDELLAVIDMRLIKDEHEMQGMRRAAAITVDMHRAAMTVTRPGRREAEVAAAMHAVLTAYQAQPSFTPIATVRGEILHNQVYPNIIEDGALLLADAGAEGPCAYASDVTRTFPANGNWSPIQRQLYDIVLQAMNEAIAACIPGKRYREVHDLAAAVICAGLVDAGFLKGKPEELVERKAHTLFFPHGVGHLIGLEVHDMEDFGDLAGYAAGRSRRGAFGDKFLRLDRDLAPGMCVTIEPGIYLVPAIWQTPELVSELSDVVHRPAVDELLQARFGGIRIEETIQVREAGGPEVLTAALPSDADEVARCVGTD